MNWKPKAEKVLYYLRLGYPITWERHLQLWGFFIWLGITISLIESYNVWLASFLSFVCLYVIDGIILRYCFGIPWQAWEKSKVWSKETIHRLKGDKK